MSALTILPGDCRETLATLPAESVQCCVTSPPYYGLRDYGTGTWEGGLPGCAHIEHSQVSATSTLGDWKSGGGQNYKKLAGGVPYSLVCGRCGAARQDKQIGLEQTPEAFVAELVAVFREVRRVLKPDGTLWLNLGDSRCNTDKWGGGQNRGKHTVAADGSVPSSAVREKRAAMPGIKPKDLIGVPWMVAFALRAEGWYLRQDIIWSKPNPMPESVTDRCTKSHEYLFLLSKSPKYYFDADAIREPAASRKDARPFGSAGGNRHGDEGRVYNSDRRESLLPDQRNKRSVWTVATKPYGEAHFATFPPDLIRPCVLAGSRGGDTILDPFGGSGTTGLVALQEGRKAILCELNLDYCDLIRRRCFVTPGFTFTEEAA